jgi:hypothetical protein
MSVKIYTIEEIKTIVEPIARKYGVARVYLFGSYARGEVTENSDVDLLSIAMKLRRQFCGWGGLCGFCT